MIGALRVYLCQQIERKYFCFLCQRLSLIRLNVNESTYLKSQNIYLICQSFISKIRQENPQKLTQLSPRSHPRHLSNRSYPRHLVGKTGNNGNDEMKKKTVSLKFFYENFSNASTIWMYCSFLCLYFSLCISHFLAWVLLFGLEFPGLNFF